MNAPRTNRSATHLSPWKRLGEGSWLRAKIAINSSRRRISAKVRQSVTIDWTLLDSARAKIKVMVKRILNKYGCPPDLQEEAARTFLAQAELL